MVFLIFGRAAPDLGFDGVERGDALDRFGCHRRGMRDMDLVELAPGMRPARDFVDIAVFIELLEASVSVGLKRTLVELQVLPWVLALAIWRVGEPYGRRGPIARRPVIANIGPEPSGLGLAVAGREYRHWCVVGMQLAGSHDMIANRFDQWREQLAGCADPSGQRGAVEVDAFASVDLRLPIERLMIGILRDQHMREQTGPASPRSIGRDGAGACTIRSQASQLSFGRT